jgi:hypothetical protein
MAQAVLVKNKTKFSKILFDYQGDEVVIQPNATVWVSSDFTTNLPDGVVMSGTNPLQQTGSVSAPISKVEQADTIAKKPAGNVNAAASVVNPS